MTQQNNSQYDLSKLNVKLPEGVSITDEQVYGELPVKKLADELKLIAIEASMPNKQYVEGKSAYYFLLERAKIAARKGSFEIRFWMSKLPWTKEELELAGDLLRKDNFAVTVQLINDIRNYDVEITVNW